MSDDKDVDVEKNVDVELARKRVLVAQIVRRGKIESINDYISAITRVVLSLIAIVIGSLEVIVPDLLSVKLSYPERYIAVGAACLIGKEIVSIASKIVNALKP